MRINVVSWNLNWVSRSRDAQERKCRWLADQPWDVVLLQEVTDSFVEAFQGAFDDVRLVFAPGAFPSGRGHCAAIALRHGWRILGERRFGDLPKVGRAVGLLAEKDGFRASIASWHAPNAAGDGRDAKMAGYQAMWSWIAEQDGG